jgi:hypothetical protein
VSLLDIDMTHVVAPPLPPPEPESAIDQLLSVPAHKMPTAAPKQPVPASKDLMKLAEEDPEEVKKNLETELMDPHFAERAQAEQEARAQHKKHQLETEHFNRIYASGLVPAAGALGTAPAAGVTPMMSSTAIPSVFVASVAGPDGTAIPMMFTGLPLTQLGSTAALPRISSSTAALPSSTAPPAKSGGFSFIKKNPDSVSVPVKEDTNPARFDFIASAINDAKTN